MPFAVQLSFDDAAENSVRAVWTTLRDRGISSFLIDVGADPHVSLGVFDDVDRPSMCDALERFARTVAPFEIRFAGVGVFIDGPGVVYFAPVVTDALVRLHAMFTEHVAVHGVSPWAHYLPHRWVPHCTAAMHVAAEHRGLAVDVCLAASPAIATVERVGLIEFEPGSRRAVTSVPLGA